jgi:outer membrane murein-binding lipoprotein Lpp
MKRAAILGMLAVLVSLLLTGCVSNSTYDKAVQETNTLNTELVQTQAELATAQQNLTALNASLKASQPYVGLASAYLALLAAVITGVQSGEVTADKNFDSALSATQDPSLQALWATVMGTTGTTERDAAQVPFLELLEQRLTQTNPQTN